MSEGVERWAINPEGNVANKAVSEQARCERQNKKELNFRV